MTSLQIEEAVAAAGLAPLPGGAAETFAAYLQLLRKWNAKLNLTAIREPGEIVRRQFLECIQCARALPSASSLLDFGSGGGFPGIPIAILRPEIEVLLGESQARKASFLREAVRTLGLNAAVYDGRIETMPRERTFDIVTLRAVDRMAEACAAAVQRVKLGGRDGGTLAVFATGATEAAIRTATPSIKWADPIPTVGLHDGVLLLGQHSTGQPDQCSTWNKAVGVSVSH